MKNYIIYIFFSVFFFLFISQSCTKVSAINKENFLYSVKGADSLYLSRYDMLSNKEPKPCIIFMVGGAFVGGMRDRPDFEPYFHRLVEEGYAVVTIDYRMGMKNVGQETDLNPIKLIRMLSNSVLVASEDLIDATVYVLDHAEEWNINKEQIITNGSSAGGVAVLQTEYFIANKTKETQKLPAGFNYAGVISFAGAILNHGDLVWNTSPCPIQLFHGDADSNVPYEKLELMGFGLYGSKYIANQLKENDLPYYFYDVENVGHTMADSPIQNNNNINEILYFINKIALGKQAISVETRIDKLGTEEVKKDFGVEDLIKSNFGL